MSRYVTPFLVINLGAEMVFVVAQRLQAQGVDHERSALGMRLLAQIPNGVCLRSIFVAA